MTDLMTLTPLAEPVFVPETVSVAVAVPAAVTATPDDDPLAGIPAELLDQVGAADRDSAGGCG